MRTIVSGVGVLLCLGCGPGDFASGGGFGSLGSEDGADEVGDSESGESETGATTPPDLPGESESETDTGNDDWGEESESEGETGETGEPLEPPDCSLDWVWIDELESIGHLSATPIGGFGDGGFVSVSPVFGPVGVDAWFRRWSPEGELVWGEELSWDELRDEPLALDHDGLGGIYVAGRINANTFEEAMVAKLDGDSGAMLWTHLEGAPGGFDALAVTPSRVVAAGEVQGQGLKVAAFDRDSGALEWSATRPVGGDVLERTGGLVVRGGEVDLLAVEAGELGTKVIRILRFSPPSAEVEVLAELGGQVFTAVPLALTELGPDRLAALYRHGGESELAIVARESGLIESTSAVADLLPADGFMTAVDLVELPAPHHGLAILGSRGAAGDDDSRSFILRLDDQLEAVCWNELAAGPLGLFHAVQPRGLVVAGDGTLSTAGWTGGSRRAGVFARWY